MVLKSFVLSKLDPQMSKSWKGIVAHELKTTYIQIWQAEKLSTWLLSSGQDFSKTFLDSKHVLKVYFKPSRKNQDFLFLPLCSELVWLKILQFYWQARKFKKNQKNFISFFYD